MAGVMRTLNCVSKLFSRLSVSTTTKCLPRNVFAAQNSDFHTTKVRCDLMEFFDDEKNWGESAVKVGRAWRTDELRIKSNEDLHKLWFVLLKEKNMLLTMEEECKREVQLFPNPERIDKVEESMKNLETVVRERNEAYFMLETGKTGERPCYMRTGSLGLKYMHRAREYRIPLIMNKKWQENHKGYRHTEDVRTFLKLYGEKRFLEKRRARKRDYNHVVGLIKRYPNLDLEAVKEQYPTVDIEKARRSKKARGHCENAY